MTIRRIFAGLLVALLLSVVSLGAACEISCSSAQKWFDCHSQLALDARLGRSAAQMDGMDMSRGGMAMPDMGNGESQSAVSAEQSSSPGHPSIVEMGPCERQSCDNRSVASFRSARSSAPQFHSFVLFTHTPRAIGTPPIFRDARDDIASFRPRNASPPTLSLRI